MDSATLTLDQAANAVADVAERSATRTGALTVKGLTHSYGSGHAVEGVTFDIPAGEVAALLGRADAASRRSCARSRV